MDAECGKTKNAWLRQWGGGRKRQRRTERGRDRWDREGGTDNTLCRLLLKAEFVGVQGHDKRLFNFLLLSVGV